MANTSDTQVTPGVHLRHSHNGHHHHGNLSSFFNSSLGSNSSLILPSPHFQLPTMNFSLIELEEISNISNITYTNQPIQNATAIPPSFLKELYTMIVPVMLFFCALTFVVNLIIVFSARWCRKPMSPTLYFSISLALADAYSSFVLGTGLVVNSLLPVYKIKWRNVCVILTLEGFRQGGVLVTVSHLLALAINHWIGIVRPLHYAATMTRRTAWTVILFSWICPILMLFIYFSSIKGQGFLSEDCDSNSFLSLITYRAFFASCFFAPLLLMSLIYLHIFLIVRNHHSHRLRYQVKNNCQQLRKNVKAAVTTILILGTYIVGWMPAILFSLIVCEDCIVKLTDERKKSLAPVGIVVNTLIILKALIDPIIYAARMSDIQMALRKMRYDILQIFCGSCVSVIPPTDVNDRFSKFDRSLYETRSLRMSSGSSSSSRRANAANAINNSLHKQHGNNDHSHVGNNSHQQNNSNHHSNCSSLENNKSAFEMTDINHHYGNQLKL